VSVLILEIKVDCRSWMITKTLKNNRIENDTLAVSSRDAMIMVTNYSAGGNVEEPL
jgi:hypothetical protein